MSKAKRRARDEDMAYPDYRFQERRDLEADWQYIPVTWLSSNDGEVRSACANIRGARDLVAECNAEVGWDTYRVVINEQGAT